MGRIRSSPVTTWVCVPTTDRHATVEVEAEGVLLGRELAVEVDEADRRQRLGGLVEQAVRVGERVVDRLHVGAALEVDHHQLGAVERLVDAPAAPGHVMGSVVERAQDALGAVEVLVDLALVPDVVAARDHVHAGREQRLGRPDGQPHAAGEVLAVGGDEVDAALLAEAGQHLLHGEPARLADDVADHEDPAGARRPRRVAVGRVAEPGALAAAGHAALPYFANSTARVSRMTVTLIWPG